MTSPARALPVAARLSALQTRHRRCTRCVAAGHIPAARPIFSGHAGCRVMLVGQAPGVVELHDHRPFAGRAGRVLMRWLTRAGFADEDDVRARVYITSTTTCFPGRRLDGSGDRRPSPAEVSLCAPWLDGALELVAPRLVLLVGGLALARLLPAAPQRLDDAVGLLFDPAGTPRGAPRSTDTRLLLPLPHPSGQSRWLNDPARVARLDGALERLRSLLPWAESGLG